MPESLQAWIKPVAQAVVIAMATAAVIGVAGMVRDEPVNAHRLKQVELEQEEARRRDKAQDERIGQIEQGIAALQVNDRWIISAMRDSGITPKSER